jgi:predicted lipoprotein
LRLIIKIALALTTAGALAACPPATKVEADAEAKRVLLGNVVDRVVLPTTREFVTEAEGLQAALEAWLAARRTGPATEERDAAKGAFRAAFLRWQRVEMMAFGPAGKSPGFALGLGLRDAIYAWPAVNPCRVDTTLVDRTYADPAFFDTALVTSTGLAVVERLLFVDAPANECPSTSALNTNGTWAALGAEELAVRRAEYASLAAAAVVKQARALRDAWVDDAAKRFSTAGLPGSGFTSAAAAVDQVFAGMFMADLTLKDDRIGVPAGLLPAQCASVPCPERAEARPSRLSRDAIVSNLDALRALLHGDLEAQGLGFDALLEARGAGALTADLEAALADARAKALALQGPVDEAVVGQLADVQALHGAVRSYTTLLKSQLVTVLSLQVPAEGAGDAD